MNNNIENMSVNAIRVLAADAVQKANSGHPGLPLGAAAIGYELWANHMNHNPKNPEWENRDRFFREDMDQPFFIHCFIFSDMGLHLMI